MKQIRQKRKTLSKRQLELIDTLAAGAEVSEALARCKVTAAQLRQWAKSEAFDQELVFRQQLAGRQSQLLIGRFVPAAAGKLIGLLGSEKEEVVRKACLDILQLAAKNSETNIFTSDKSETSLLPPELAEKLLNLLAEEKRSA